MKSVFKSDAARDTFRAYYSAVLSRFPFEQRYVDTAFGRTFILSAGTIGNPPVVLLHGSCSNSVFMTPEILALSQEYRVFAVDIPGEAGNSSEFRPNLHTDDFAFWMRDVLDALGLDRVTLIGNSLGGWMALKFAVAFPFRVTKLVLLASAGLAPIRETFLRNAEIARGQENTAPIGGSPLAEPSLPKEVLDFICLIMASYDPIKELPVFSDEQLLTLAIPVLFIDGTNDEIINAADSAERLIRYVPTAEIRLLPGIGHVIQNAVSYIIPFLVKGDKS